jgi:hypothetical protein
LRRFASRVVPFLNKSRWSRRGTTDYADGDPANDYAVRSDWTRSEGGLNYSTFVYFDVNRDGRYSVGDRPMGGIRVRLLKDGRNIASARTNANGFANFSTSTRRKRAPIHHPGDYAFEVSVPTGWTVTGGGARQVKEFKLIPGSVSGIGTDEMLQPVGLAPNRVVSGRLADGARLSVEALSGKTVVEKTEITGQPEFCYRVPDAADAVDLSVAGWKQRLESFAYPIEVGLVDPARRPLDPRRKVQTIGFDDVNSRGLRKIPSGYAELNWFNLNAMARDFSGSTQGYVNGNTSGDWIAYTSSGHPGEIYADDPFDFIGVHLSAAWLNSEGEIGKIEAWRGDSLVATDTVVLSALTPVYYSPRLPDVTRVRFSTEHYWQMVLDDLVIAR